MLFSPFALIANLQGGFLQMVSSRICSLSENNHSFDVTVSPACSVVKFGVLYSLSVQRSAATLKHLRYFPQKCSRHQLTQRPYNGYDLWLTFHLQFSNCIHATEVMHYHIWRRRRNARQRSSHNYCTSIVNTTNGRQVDTTSNIQTPPATPPQTIEDSGAQQAQVNRWTRQMAVRFMPVWMAITFVTTKCMVEDLGAILRVAALRWPVVADRKKTSRGHSECLLIMTCMGKVES